MLPTYKDIVDLIQKGQTLKAQEKIMELSEANLNLREENQRLKSENQKLQERLTIRDNLVLENSACWLEKDGKREGPYCQPCWDDKNKLIRLQEDSYAFHCRVCKQDFEKQNSGMPRFEGQGITDPKVGF